MDEEKNVWNVKVFDDLRGEDLALVAEFFNESFPGVFYPRCLPEIWKWKLGPSNPAGRGFLTVAFLNGRVVGTTSGTRQRITLGNESVAAMEIGDTFTHADFRKSGFCQEDYPGTSGKEHYLNRSVFGRLVTETLDRAAKEKVEYVFGTPNLNSRPPYLSKLSFREIGYGKVKSWSLITSSRTFAPRYRLPAFFLAGASKLAVTIGRITTSWRFSARESTFDALSSTLRDLMPRDDSPNKTEQSLYFNQNLEFFEHRYLRHPSHHYRYFEIRTKKELIGWVICTQIRRQSGRETLVVSDWIAFSEFFVRDLPNYISLILPFFRGLDSITVWAAKTATSRFHWGRFGFLGTKDVSIIERCLTLKTAEPVQEFANFRIGWSDNG